jgi:hypothetical protein
MLVQAILNDSTVQTCAVLSLSAVRPIFVVREQAHTTILRDFIGRYRADSLAGVASRLARKPLQLAHHL